MGFSFYSTGCVKHPKECWNESHTIIGSAPAAKTKEKPAGLRRRVFGRCSRGMRGPRLIKTVAAHVSKYPDSLPAGVNRRLTPHRRESARGLGGGRQLKRPPPQAIRPAIRIIATTLLTLDACSPACVSDGGDARHGGG
jgi:hypothetical protein